MTQPAKKPNLALTALLSLLAVASIALAVVYFTTSAADLPSYLPGHEAGVTRHHTKHGIGMVVVALVFGIAAYFSTGSKDPERSA